jgi:hypothetical protein
MATARFWKKWLRLGEQWLRKRITSVSSQPIAVRQPGLRVLLPNEATLVPCVAAKPALAHLRPWTLALGTLGLSADTLPNLPRRNASPTTANAKAPSRFLCYWRDDGAARPLVAKGPQAYLLLEVVCCLEGRAAGALLGTGESRPVCSPN